MKMKKYFIYMLAASLTLSGLTVTSCAGIEDNPVMREDMPESVYGREELLSGASSERGGYFAVPRSFQ